MQNQVKFIAADGQGVIQNEVWQATKAYCPRCGKNHANVWMLMSEQPLRAGNQEFRLFLCIACGFTAFGLHGFQPSFDARQRAQYIIKEAFAEASK